MKMRNHSHLVLVLTVSLLAGSQFTAVFADDDSSVRTDDPLDAVAWMAGDWHGESGPMSYEESWTASADGTMIGMFRLLNGGSFLLSEHLSMEAEDGKIVMRILHFGRKMVAQESEPLVAIATKVTDNKAVFQAPEDAESPLTVTYELSDDGETLTATVEAVHDGQEEKFVLPFQRGKAE